MAPPRSTDSLKHTKTGSKARRGELAALKESEQRFRALVAASFDVVFRMSPDWREMRHLVGKEFIPDTDNPNTSWLDLYIHPDDQPHMLAVINEAIRTKGTFDLEHRVLRVDGTLGWTHSRAIPVLAADGEIIEWFGMASDITARKRMEEELRRHRENLAQLVEERTEQLARSERHYRTLVENFPGVVSRYDRDLRYIYRSPQQNVYTADLARREILGKTLAELGIPAAEYGPWREKYREAFDTGSVVEFETGYLDKNGELTEYLVRVVPEKNGTGQVESLLAFTLDITERKRNRELLNAFLEGMQDGFYVLDRELRFIYVNRSMARIWGLKPEDLIGKSIASVFPGIIEQSLGKFRQALGTQTPQDYEVLSRVIDRWVHMHVSPFRDGLAVFCLDIDDHERAKDALKNSEDKFAMIFAASPVMIVIIRMADNRYVEVNEKFLEVIGYTRAEVIGRTPCELGLWAVDAAKGEALLSELGKNGEYHNAEFRITTRTGKLVTALTSSLLINFNGEQCRLATMLDISKEKHLEAELQRLDRLNIVGEMAAAIGHEVRNPLTTVRGYLQMLQRRQAFSGHREQFDIMIGELDRANTIISDFLSLAKNKAVELKKHNLNDVVNSLQPLLQSEAFRAGQELKVDIADIPSFAMDEKEIRQLLLNLSNNAFHAMEPGGTLTIATGVEKGKVVLTIRDTGHGIPPEVLEKLGTPFVTTKENGTGLGLPVCYRIVERHGGKIDVKTSPAGTTFTIRLKPKQ